MAICIFENANSNQRFVQAFNQGQIDLAQVSMQMKSKFICCSVSVSCAKFSKKTVILDMLVAFILRSNKQIQIGSLQIARFRFG